MVKNKVQQSFLNQTQIDKIFAIALEAGEIAKNFWQERNFEIFKKADNSKVTSADIAISKLIRHKLEELFPQIAIICEEGDLRQAQDLFWLVDPIDGTSSFIEQSPEFSINIALVNDKKAVFGLIYAPLFEGGKIFICDENSEVFLINKNLKTKCLQSNTDFDSDKIRVVTSSRTKDSDVHKFISQFYPQFSQNFVVEKLSSAIKFFRILESSCDLYLHFRPSMEWDIAAGQALVELIGGKVRNLSFNQEQFFVSDEMSYLKPDFRNSAFIVIPKGQFFLKNTS